MATERECSWTLETFVKLCEMELWQERRRPLSVRRLKWECEAFKHDMMDGKHCHCQQLTQAPPRPLPPPLLWPLTQQFHTRPLPSVVVHWCLSFLCSSVSASWFRSACPTSCFSRLTVAANSLIARLANAVKHCVVWQRRHKFACRLHSVGLAIGAVSNITSGDPYCTGWQSNKGNNDLVFMMPCEAGWPKCFSIKRGGGSITQKGL